MYLKLRNARILAKPLNAPEAAELCQRYRSNARWTLVEAAPVMHQVWRVAGRRGFAIRRIVDARLALTLRYHGVTEFATTNVKDFRGFDFDRVWNPVSAHS